MEITRVITKMAAGSNSSVWQDLLLLSRQNEFSDLPAGCCGKFIHRFSACNRVEMHVEPPGCVFPTR